jgi:hypothetical protein
MNSASTPSPNQFFSYPRWRGLVAMHWAENRKRYGLSLLAMAGLLTAWYGFILATDHIDPLNIFFQYSAYFVGLYLTGCLYASSLFSQLSVKRDAIGFLSLPASHFEKLLCALFFGTLLFFVCFTLIFYLVNIPMVGLANRIIATWPRNFPFSTQRVPALAVYNIFSDRAGAQAEVEMHIFLYGFFAIQSVFLLGSVYFTRYAFIKTVVICTLSVLLFTVLEKELLNNSMPATWQNDLLEWNKHDPAFSPVKASVRLPAGMEPVIIGLIRCGLPLFFWFVTLQRLKEKEV